MRATTAATGIHALCRNTTHPHNLRFSKAVMLPRRAG